MSLHLLGWRNITNYGLFKETGEKGREGFVRYLKHLLDSRSLYTEEALVVIKNGYETDKYLEPFGLVPVEMPLSAVILPVHKPISTNPVRNSHSANRVEILTASANHVGELVLEYLEGVERARHLYEDGIRRGHDLIVYDHVLRGELFELIEKLGETAVDLQTV